MAYRTKTYIAGDWTGDKSAIEQLYKWKDSKYWSLSFVDAHDLQQAKDSSLNCTIKKSLGTRMDVSKAFVLIVGDNTTSLRAGRCSYFIYYSKSPYTRCTLGYGLSEKSYIEYECDKAIRDGLKIVVLYNKTYNAKSLCPAALRDVGTHAPMKKRDASGNVVWDYESVRKAIMD